MNNCHPGPCTNENECNKKIKLFCSCKRIKKDYVCSIVQKQEISIKCDEICIKLKNEKRQAEAALLEQRRQAEEMRNQEEIKKFERKFKSRRKGRDKLDRKLFHEEPCNNYRKCWILTILVALISILIYYVGMTKL